MPARPPLRSPAFVRLCGAAVLVYLSFYLLLPVLPVYAARQGLSESAVGLVVGTFALTAMALKPWVGWVLDWHGRRGLLLAGAGLFAVASLLYPLARSLPGFLLIRVVHGAGMGCFPTAGLAAVADLTPPERRGEAMGLFGMASNVGLVVGPLLGVTLERRHGFTTLCLASGLLGGTGLLLGLRVPETGHRRTPPPPRLATLLAPPALRPAFLTLAAFLPYGAVISFVPLLAASRTLGNPGSFFGLLALALLTVRAPAGRLADQIGRAGVAGPALATLAAGLLALAVARGGGLFYAAGLLVGVGMGAAQPALMAWAADCVPPGDRGKAVATFHTAWELGIGAGSILSGLLLPALGFGGLFTLGALVALAGSSLALAPPRARGSLAP